MNCYVLLRPVTVCYATLHPVTGSLRTRYAFVTPKIRTSNPLTLKTKGLCVFWPILRTENRKNVTFAYIYINYLINGRLFLAALKSSPAGR